MKHLKPQSNKTEKVIAIYKRLALGDNLIINNNDNLSYRHKFILTMVDGDIDVLKDASKLYPHWDIIQIIRDLTYLKLITKYKYKKPLLNPVLNIKTPDIKSIKNNEQTKEIGLKDQLISLLKNKLPDKNHKYINKIQECDNSKEALLKICNKICVLIKLTQSEKTAITLKTDFLQILS